MPDDILPPNGDPPPARRERELGDPVRRTCGFCECVITRHGEVLHLGETAKRHQKHEKTIETQSERIEKLEAENRELRAKLAESEGSKRGKGWDVLV